MEIYSLNLSYINNYIYELVMQLSSNYKQSILMFSLLVALVSIISLSRKIRKIEKTQINDIDDVIGFNHLINEEIGLIKAQQDELNKYINSAEHKISSSTHTESEGKLFNNAPYSQAVQLARRGYAREDIISLCSLTESEAELILALHSNTKAA